MTTTSDLKWVIKNEDTFARYKEKLQDDIGSKSQIGHLILSVQEDPQFPREAIVGTAAEKEAIRERNKLVERRERKWIDEHTKVYYELKQYLHDSAINRLKRFRQRWEQIETEKNPVKLWKFINDTFQVTPAYRQSKLRAYRMELDAIYQKPGESYVDFQVRFDAVAELAAQIEPFEDSFLIEKFLKGLDKSRHGYTYTIISKPNITTYDELIEKLKQTEDELDATKTRAQYESYNVKTEIPASTPNQEIINYNNEKKRKRNFHRPKEQKVNKYKKPKIAKDYKDYKNSKICTICYRFHKGNSDKKAKWESHNTKDCKFSKFSKNQKDHSKRNLNEENEQNYLIQSLNECQESDNNTVQYNLMNLETMNKTVSRSSIIFDPGATIHIFNDKIPRRNLYSGQPKRIEQYTNHYNVSKYVNTIDFGEGLYIPEGPGSLISQKVAKTRFNIHYNNHEDEYILTNKQNLDEFYFRPNQNGLYELSSIKRANESIHYSKEDKNDLVWRLHRILGHPGESALIQTIKSESYNSWGITKVDIEKANLRNCAFCLIGKMDKRRHRTKPKPTTKKESIVGQHLHVDIVYVRKKEGQQLYLLAVEGSSKYIQLVKLKKKDTIALTEAIKLVTGYFKPLRVTVHSDREAGILSSKELLFAEGIMTVNTGAGEHERVVENVIGTLRKKFRAILYSLEYELPLQLYPALFEHVAFLHNITANKRTGDKLPFEIITKKKFEGRYATYEFGQLGFFHNNNTKGSYDKRAEFGILTGWNYESSSIKGYTFPKGETINRTKFVPVALETLPLEIQKEINQKEKTQSLTIDLPKEEEYGDVGTLSENDNSINRESVAASPVEFGTKDTNKEEKALSRQSQSPTGGILLCNPGITLIAGAQTKDEVAAHHGKNSDQNDHIDGQKESLIREEALNEKSEHHSQETQSASATESATIDASERTKTTSAVRRNRRRIDFNEYNNTGTKRYKADDVATSSSEFEGVILATNHRPKIIKANSELTEGVFLTKDYLDHKTKTKLVESGKIKEAIEKELLQMLRLKVWEPVLPKMMNLVEKTKIVPSKVFTITKLGPDGKFIKVKARLVAGGHRERMDPSSDTYSPTIRPETVMINLNIAATKDLNIDSIDVGAAFLEAPLAKEIYVLLDSQTSKYLTQIEPKYHLYLSEKGTILVKLLKAMYGLKESSKEWFNHLSKILRNEGYEQSKNDSAMFTKRMKNGEIHVVITYVDDILSIGSPQVLQTFRNFLKDKFDKITYEENPNVIHYLGMIIKRFRNKKSMFVYQPGFLKEILKPFNLQKDDTSPTPATDKLFTNTGSDDKGDEKKFRSVLMKLMFLTRTRPDIKLPVVYLSTKMQNPTKGDEQNLMRIIRYLNGTKELGLYIKPNSLMLYCSTDASYASHQDLKGHSGAVVSIGNPNAPIHALSKKQRIVTKSSTEAEILALESATEEILWSKRVLDELGHPQNEVPIEQDNKSAMIIIKRGPGKMGKSKSIQIKYYWITQKVEDGTISLKYIPSKQVLADGLTKPLNGSNFYEWRKVILNLDEKVKDIPNVAI